MDVATMTPAKACSIAGRLHTFCVKPIEQTSWSQGRWTFAGVEALDSMNDDNTETAVWLPRGTRLEEVMAVTARLKIVKTTVVGGVVTEYLLIAE